LEIEQAMPSRGGGQALSFYVLWPQVKFERFGSGRAEPGHPGLTRTRSN